MCGNERSGTATLLRLQGVFVRMAKRPSVRYFFSFPGHEMATPGEFFRGHEMSAKKADSWLGFQSHEMGTMWVRPVGMKWQDSDGHEMVLLWFVWFSRSPVIWDHWLLAY
jgi:hypothetical protein